MESGMTCAELLSLRPAPGRRDSQGAEGEGTQTMRRAVLLVMICAVLGIGAAGYATAQDTPGTPTIDAQLCASPGASPAAAGEASPTVITTGSPEAVASSVLTNIEGGLDQVSCGTPAATPGV